MIKPKFIYFSADQQFIISFIRIKNLIKTLLTLKPKLPISTPKIQEPILSDFKKSRFLYAGVCCIISEEKRGTTPSLFLEYNLCFHFPLTSEHLP